MAYALNAQRTEATMNKQDKAIDKIDKECKRLLRVIPKEELHLYPLLTIYANPAKTLKAPEHVKGWGYGWGVKSPATARP